MSSAIWTAPGSNVPLAFHGRLQFEDITQPVTGKDEWGLDTLERTLKGPAHLFRACSEALRQGAEYRGYFLQSWRPIDHPYAPGFSLTYKGCQNGIPNPLIAIGRCELMSSINATNLYVTYHGKVIVEATREIKYIAPHASYRYITDREPSGPRYSSARVSGVQVIDSRTYITFDDGTSQVLVGAAPAAVATALFATPVVFVTGPSAVQVFGTPFWECEDQVVLRYPES